MSGALGVLLFPVLLVPGSLPPEPKEKVGEERKEVTERLRTSFTPLFLHNWEGAAGFFSATG